MFDATLVDAVKTWLGRKGIAFFREIKANHGTVLAVWNEDGIPHSVHFREGMQVRNKLRELTNYQWTAHEYDERWHLIIEECLI